MNKYKRCTHKVVNKIYMSRPRYRLPGLVKVLLLDLRFSGLLLWWMVFAYSPHDNLYEYKEPWWNDVDRGKPKNSEQILSQYHSVHQIPHAKIQARTRATVVRRWRLTALAMVHSDKGISFPKNETQKEKRFCIQSRNITHDASLGEILIIN
jgi:hypothetical protein